MPSLLDYLLPSRRGLLDTEETPRLGPGGLLASDTERLPGVTSGAPGLPWGVLPDNPIATWVMQQRQLAQDQGLWNPATGLPTGKGLVDAAGQTAEAILMGTTAPGEVPAGITDRISTRVPTSVKFAANPHADDSLVIDRQAMRDAPATYQKNAELLQDKASYPGLGAPEGATPDEAFDVLHDHVKDNLRWLYSSVPDAVRDRAPQWYDGGHAITKAWAADYDVLPRQAAATIAALSPQMVWDKNVSLAKRILDVRRDRGDTLMTPAMSERINGYAAAKKQPGQQQIVRDAHDRFGSTPFGELTDPMDQAIWTRAYDEAHNPRSFPIVSPEGRFGDLAINLSGSPSEVGWGSFADIAKAHAVLNDGSLENISASMGGNHKVRNFYNNLVDPSDPRSVTIDTHAIAAAHLMPLGGSHPVVENGLGLAGSASNLTGAKGLYGVYADAYRSLADELGILPRQLQSVTWEGVRGLFGDVDKRNAGFVRDIGDIWQGHRNGEYDADAARALIHQRAGGITRPAWDR